MLIRARRLRHWLIALSIGGSSLIATGCDARTSESILSGLQSATTTLLDALLDAAFQALAEDETPPVTTV